MEIVINILMELLGIVVQLFPNKSKEVLNEIFSCNMIKLSVGYIVITLIILVVNRKILQKKDLEIQKKDLEIQKLKDEREKLLRYKDESINNINSTEGNEISGIHICGVHANNCYKVFDIKENSGKED